MNFHLLTDLKQAALEWLEDDAPRLGAALAFYSLLSLAPTVMLLLAVGRMAFGEQAVSGELTTQMENLFGPAGAQVVADLLAHRQDRDNTLFASLMGLLMLVIGASAAFGELQAALNRIWDIAPRPRRRWVQIVRERLASFLLVLGAGLLLLASLLMTTVIAFLERNVTGVPLLASAWMWLTSAVTFGLICVLFALVFKSVPDVHLAWRDVAAGAILTATLFTLGKQAFGVYVAWSGTASAYGAAGSLVVLILWIYYSAQILFFGAEFAHVRTLRHRRAVGETPPHSTED